MLFQKSFGNEDRRAFPGVASVGFEGETENTDPLARQGIEHGRHHVHDESFLLVGVYIYNAFPVVGHLFQTVETAEIDKIEDVLLEAGASETHARVEEFSSDPAVHAHGAGHLRDIRLGFLAQGRDGVDGGDTLGQEGVGHQFGQLAAPDIGGDDPIPGNPAGVDFHNGVPGRSSPFSFPGTNEDPVGIFQIPDRRSFGEKFRVGQDVKGNAVGLAVENPLHGQGRLDRQGALFDDDLVRDGVFQDLAGCLLPVLEIGGHAGAGAEGFRGGVDADEDDVAVANSTFDVGAEKEILPPHGADKFIQPRFVDRQIIGIPCGDPLGIYVHHRHPVVGTLGGDHGHGGSADIAGAYTEDVLFIYCIKLRFHVFLSRFKNIFFPRRRRWPGRTSIRGIRCR